MLKNRQELIEYRGLAEKDYAAQQKKIIVCAGTGCVAGGSLNIFDELKRIIEEKGLPVEIGLMEDGKLSSQVQHFLETKSIGER